MALARCASGWALVVAVVLLPPALSACPPDELDCYATATCPTAGSGGDSATGGASSQGGVGPGGGAGAGQGGEGGRGQGGGGTKQNGDGCDAASECASGFCADGVCCDAACDQPCDACNLMGSAGSCKPLAATVSPQAPGCGAYLCDGTNAACPTSCASDAACVLGSACSLEPPGCTVKKCGPKLVQGAACCGDATLHGCATGHCANGVCCDAVVLIRFGGQVVVVVSGVS
jgi:hypothetical protein